MELNNFRHRVFVLLAVIVTSILLILLDSIGAVSSVHDLSAVIIVPIRLRFKKVSLQVNDVLGVVVQIVDLKASNEQLRQENRDYLEEISKLQEQGKENELLRDRLGLQRLEQEWILQARVIGNDPTRSDFLQIDAGTDKGVDRHDIIVLGQFVVGIVDKVGRYSSTILLITSSSSNIPARGQNDRAIGLVRGEFATTLKMTDILMDEKVEEQEIVVTSGVDSYFPAGLIIGVVSEVHNDPVSAMQEALVEIQFDPSRLDYIYVIKGQGQ